MRVCIYVIIFIQKSLFSNCNAFDFDSNILGETSDLDSTACRLMLVKKL